MQVNRDERLAKAHGLSILGLMAVIALTVYFWPAPPAPVMTSPPLMSGPSLVPATAPPVHRAPKRPHAPRPGRLRRRPRAYRPSRLNCRALSSSPHH